MEGSQVVEQAQYDAFISYAEADRPWVEGYLVDALQQAGVRCHGETAFRLGVPRLLEFERAVQHSRRVLLILSPAYVTDGFIQFTTILAQHLGLESGTWPVVPILLHDVEMPSHLRVLEGLDAREASAWPGVVKRLCQEFGRPDPPESALPPCPYPGMLPFSSSDARFFCGRQAEIETLIQLLRHQNLLFVIGPSGCGKSSLIDAGLLPALQSSGRSPGGVWLVRKLRPGSDPLLRLKETIGDHLDKAGTSIDGLLAEHRAAQRLLLVIDQFEETFTRADPAQQKEFVCALKGLTDTENCALLIAMRADFYPQLMNCDFWPVDPSQRFEIAPLRGAALHQAIEQPALDAGIYIEAALIERLLADAAGEPGVLPHMQETMVVLWEGMKRRLLSLDMYARLGDQERSGLAVAVARKADAAFAALMPDQQDIARRVLVNLVQLGDGGPDTRRQLSLQSLRQLPGDPRQFDFVLEHLTQNRLLIQSSDQNLGPQVDLSHEALITSWPRLKEWLQRNRAALLLQRRLSAATDEWLERGREPSLLFGGSLLRDSQQFAAEHPGELASEHQTFLDASAEAEARRTRSRHLSRATGGSIGAGVGYGLTFSFAAWAKGIDGVGYALLVLIVFLPFGMLVGYSIGLGLWLFRANSVRRILGTSLAGGLSSTVTYTAFAFLALAGPVGLSDIADGFLVGAGMGAGAGLSDSARLQLAGTILGALVGVGLSLTTGGNSTTGGISWSVPVTVVSGVLLGTLTGLGFYVNAVDQREGSRLRR